MDTRGKSFIACSDWIVFLSFLIYSELMVLFCGCFWAVWSIMECTVSKKKICIRKMISSFHWFCNAFYVIPVITFFYTETCYKQLLWYLKWIWYQGDPTLFCHLV
jgi:hypothetical protein